MTLVNIDLRNQGYETSPGDRVVFYSLLVREGDFGTISTAPVEVELADGQGTVDLAPGPVGVQIIAGQVADTRVKIGEVPPSGPTTLNAVMMVTPAYTPALQKMMIAAVERAKELALEQVDREVSIAVSSEVGQAIYSASAAAQTAASDAAAAQLSATSADARATVAESKSANAVSRVSALEVMGGLAPGQPIDGQTANLIEQPETITHRAVGAVSVKAYSEEAGVVMAPYMASLEDVQASADAAAARVTPHNSVPVVAAGIIETDQTLYIKSDADLSRLTIRYSGAGVAVQVGTGTALLQNITVHAPKIINTVNTVGGNWANVPGSVGLRIVNISQSTVHVPYISHFEAGLLVDGRNNIGNAYNHIHLGMLYNNKGNLVMDSDGMGWTTQNTYYGGRYAYASAEGANVAGAYQIWVKPSLPGSPRNATSNNVFINPSVEGNTPEHHLNIAGKYNIFINPRLETGNAGIFPRIRFYDGAEHNQLMGGFHTENVDITNETGSSNNTWYGVRKMSVRASGPDPALEIAKEGLSTSHIEFEPHGSDFGWIWKANGRGLQGRREGDQFPRVDLDHYEGRLLLGDGSSAPTAGVRHHPAGTQMLTNLLINATSDIGVGSQRPRFVRANTGLVTGSFTTSQIPDPTGMEDGTVILDRTQKRLLVAMAGQWFATGELTAA